MAHAKSAYPTLYTLLSKVTMSQVRRGRGVRYATSGYNPVAFPKRREGLHTLHPEQLLSARIPLQRIENGNIHGYQRILVISKARAIARFMTANPNYLKEMPVIEISVDGDQAFITDGQHRAVAAVLANLPIRAVLTKRSTAEARRLFANQARATSPSRNLLILDAEGVYEEYIQDAVTDPNHPWYHLVSGSQRGFSGNKISAATAYNMLRTYVGLMSGGSHHASDQAIARFDKQVADELAPLLECFGNRQTNPYAYSAVGLRAISEASRKVFRDQEPAPGDKERWIRHMPRFPFARYAYLRSSADLTDQLVRWWNRKLPEARKVRS